MGQKIALVTGAGSGIGRAVALRLAGAGYAVVLAGRRAAELDRTRALAPQADMLAIPTDVTDPDAVEHLFAQTQKAYGRLDVLFNNAGIGARPVPIDELSIDEWKNVVDVNINGAFYCARAAFAQMRRQQPQGGRIINNGSISAYMPRPFSAPYTATKHAVLGLTRALALDGRPYNIACSEIDIGNAATDMTERMAQGVLQANLTTMVEPRMDVQHVADAVLYMADLPLSANVLTMTVMATAMPFVGRG